MPESLTKAFLSHDPGLISLDEACRRAASHADAICAEEVVSIADARHRVLARDVVAQIALPRFDQSAMDGYALAASSLTAIESQLVVEARIPAGSASGPLPAGAAARIFTGAPIPEGADTIVMQEHVRRDGACISLDGHVRKGSNIRRRGEDISEGEILLRRGHRLGIPHLALLAAQGYARVAVFRRARVVFLATGNEVRRAEEPLSETSVYDSNLPMLMALEGEAGLEPCDGGRAPDEAGIIARKLAELADSFDLIVTTGGASVGDEDHALAAIAAKGSAFERLKIAVKPGKPAIIGRVGSAAYLGLPGNPVACLIAWLFLGNAVLAALNGAELCRPTGYLMPLFSDFSHKPGRDEFAPARVVATTHGPRIEILGRGGSARLKPLIHADGLAKISADSGDLSMGDCVLFHPFRDGFSV